MRRILLTGKNGQVGWELQRTLMTLGQVVAVDRTTMDLSAPDSIRDCIRAVEPELIVNAAAYTAVDKAESEPELAMAINGVAPGIIAEEAKRINAALVHYSTDYVFDGNKQEPYTERDPPNPLNVYGKTKLAGEKAIEEVGVRHLVFRTSWVYGARGVNFLRKILRLAEEQDEIRVVDDQIGAPTWSRTIAETTSQVLAKLSFGTDEVSEVSGVYNLTSSGETSWFGFAMTIFEHGSTTMGPTSPKLLPIRASEYPVRACRPKNSRLDNTKLTKRLDLVLPQWERCVDLCLEELVR